jgi:hypothetical protein
MLVGAWANVLFLGKGFYASRADRRKHHEFCLKTFWKLFKKNSNKSAEWLKAATTK